jgi:hypothetical protein
MKRRTRRASRVSRTNKIRAFWRKSAIGLQPQPGAMDAGSLDRSCSRPTNASLRRREIGRERQILRPPCNSSDPFRYLTLTYVRNANKRTVIVGLRSNYYSARLKSDLGFP